MKTDSRGNALFFQKRKSVKKTFHLFLRLFTFGKGEAT